MGVGRGICLSMNVATRHARPVGGARVGNACQLGYDHWARVGQQETLGETVRLSCVLQAVADRLFFDSSDMDYCVRLS